MGLTVIVFLPSIIYLLSSIHRHLNGSKLSTDKKLMEVGNSFGMLATVALAWLLIPVSSKGGPIGRLFSLDPIKFLQLYHIWTGRIVVGGAVIHGLFHTYRYAIQGGPILMSYMFPPIQCFIHPQTFEPPICELADEGDCSCYDHFIPFTGLVAGCGLVVIGISSLYKFRRSSYAYFAMIHYVTSPLTFAAICVHYNKAILYASGSLLYYLASNYPVWIEFLGKRIRQQPLKIVSIEKMDADPCQSDRPCVAVTMEASITAVNQYRPGVYGRLVVPSLSQIPHPFTINRVPNQPHRLRVIFRVTGKFTRALDKSLVASSSTKMAANGEESEAVDFAENLPNIYLSGFYGSGKLMNQISQHDNCVIIAAGVGITPYLSIFSGLAGDGYVSDGIVKNQSSVTPKTIILHWMCRDETLIEYCRKEYLDRCLKITTTDGLSIKIYIHHTTAGRDTFVDDESIERGTTTRQIHYMDCSAIPGSPFDISKFTIGESIRKNLVNFVVFGLLSWGGLWFVWNWYLEQDSEEFVGRFATIIIVMIYGLVVAVAVNILFYLNSFRRHETWNPVSINEDNGDENGFGHVETDNLELSTYADTEGTLSSEPIAVPESMGNENLTVTIKKLNGRPGLNDLLENIHDGRDPALFCCVPSKLAKTIDNALGKSKCSTSTSVPVYEESFEI